MIQNIIYDEWDKDKKKNAVLTRDNIWMTKLITTHSYYFLFDILYHNPPVSTLAINNMYCTAFVYTFLVLFNHCITRANGPWANMTSGSIKWDIIDESLPGSNHAVYNEQLLIVLHLYYSVTASPKSLSLGQTWLLVYLRRHGIIYKIFIGWTYKMFRQNNRSNGFTHVL